MHGVIIDITNNFLAFWPSYCTYIKVIFSLSLPSLLIETIVMRIKKDITFQKMIKKSLNEDMTNFLQMPNKLFSKKKRPINKSK